MRALGRKVFDLYTGRGRTGYETHLELASRGGEPKSADDAITRFLRLLSALPPRDRARWNRATRRDFNIGIQGGTAPHAFEVALRPRTLEAVARVRARVVVTVYATDRARARPRGRRR